MNPSKVAISLLFLTISLLLLSGCAGMLPTESNTPAVVPNPEPGAPIPGGLRIVSARATPLLDDSLFSKKGAVNVHFNGAATKPVYVDVSAQPPGKAFYTDVGMATLHPGQTDVQVPIKVDVREPAQIPLKVTTRGATGEFLTTTHYKGGTGESQERGSASGQGLNGRWFHDGKPTSISVSSGGQSVTITNEQGQSSSGSMSGNEIVLSSGITGHVSQGGQRISWSNGTEWKR
jgi:hypothetical protein